MKIRFGLGMVTMFLIFSWISCGHQLHGGTNIKNLFTNTFTITPPIYRDTALTLPTRSTVEIQTTERVAQLARPSVSVETLLYRNMELQRVYLRSVDRNYQLRSANDSFKNTLNAIRQDQLTEDKAAAKYRSETKRITFIKEQNNVSSKVSNTTCLICLIVICLLTLFIKIAEKLPKFIQFLKRFVKKFRYT